MRKNVVLRNKKLEPKKDAQGKEIKKTYFEGRVMRGVSKVWTTLANTKRHHDAVREKYGSLMVAAEGELKAKEAKFGESEILSHTYFTLDGYPTGTMRKQRGAVEVLEEAKKFVDVP